VSDNVNPDYDFENISDDYPEFASFTCPIPQNESISDYVAKHPDLYNQSPVFPINADFLMHDKCFIEMYENENNSPVVADHKPHDKRVLALELVTVTATAGLVGTNLIVVMGGSIALVSGISGIYNSYDYNPIADDLLSNAVKYSQGVLRHAVFYEIATHEVARTWFKQNILINSLDWRLKYPVDLFYFTTGNVLSNWAADSLTDIQNKLFIEDEESKIKVKLDPFLTKKAPTTASKRIIKEVVKDSAIFSFLYCKSSVQNFGQYLGYRINPLTRIPLYTSFDDTTLPSALAHFASNVAISTYYNGFDFTNTTKTFAHTAAKYAPEYLLSKYVFKDQGGRFVKYSTIAVTSFTYLAAKILLPNH
jgi:hypothetical protein